MATPMKDYNPYALVQLLVNGKPIDGRPIAFDSDVVNQKTMKNAFGNFVKPSKVMSVCPDCGQGIEISLHLPDPPFQPYACACPYCRPTPPPVVDPFVNPIQSGRVHLAELDPLLHNPDKPLEEGSVSDRFCLPQDLSPEPVLTPGSESVASAPLKTQKPAPVKEEAPVRQREPEPDREIPLEAADGITEEVDFDDREMIDDE
jgi:hypothetical protein